MQTIRYFIIAVSFISFSAAFPNILHGQAAAIPSFSPPIPFLGGGVHAWGDFDGDNDLDLFHSGIDSLGGRSAYLLINNGLTLVPDTSQSLEGVASGSADWADYDGDGDLDLAVTGSRAYLAPFTRIYRNDNGILQSSGIPLPQMLQGYLKWADLDGDGDADLVLGGTDQLNGLAAYLYENLGGGSFRQRQHPLLEGLYSGDIDVWDINGDGRLDIVISGNSDFSESYTRGLENLGGFQFRQMQGVVNSGVYPGIQIARESGNPQSLFSLAAHDSQGFSEVYAFQGGQFVLVTDTLVGVTYGDVQWLDFDNDQDSDLVIAGKSKYGDLMRIYENTGSGFVVFQLGNNLPALRNCKLASADWNNDGFPDLLISGFAPNSQARSFILTFDNNQQAFRP